MKIKILLCGCNGRKLQPEQIDMNSLPSMLEGDLDVRYVLTHPLLCGPGGNEALSDILRASDHNTYIVLGGCDPDTQTVYFGDIVDQSGFPRERVIHVDIRGADNLVAAERILSAVAAVAEKEGVSHVTDGFGG